MYEQLFTHQEDVFKVIANRKRLEIIQLLTHGELPVGEMVAMLGIPQANVSQHLSLLRNAGIVETRRDGTTIHYHLSDPRIAEACSLIRQFLFETDGAALEVDPEALYPLVQDRVCRMRMGVAEASEQTKHAGETFYFCAAGCKKKFLANPSRYMSKKNKARK